MSNRYQQPCQADWSDEQKQQDRTIFRPLAIFAGVVVAVSALTYGCQDSTYKTAMIQHSQAMAATPQLTSEQEEYRKFFAKHGSPAPAEMAKAVTAVKPQNRPVLAAVAIKESGGDPKAVGDGGDSRGAWQIQPQHWGKVNSDPVKQALHAERILEELAASNARGSLLCRKTLARYNGGHSYPRVSLRYADRVIALAKQVPRP